MNARRLLLCAAASVLASSCATSPSRPPTPPSPSTQFETTISRLQRADPGSPAALDVQLAYAAYLLKDNSGGSSCGNRLTLAQEQLGSVTANPKSRVIFPDGWALVADLEYRQHLARAACASRLDRRDELLAALEAARRAVTLYRNEFDYHSMVIMQFDAAATLHQLGNEAAAVTDLEMALRMDRDYGFRDDARQNYQLLLSWRGQPAGAAQVAGLMRDFPQRRATFTFGWHPADAQIALEHRRVSLSEGQIVHSRGVADFDRHIAAAQKGGWAVSYSNRLSAYEPGVWPLEKSPKLRQLTFPPATLPAVDFTVSATGGFDGVTDPQSFAPRLIARTSALIRAGTPPGHDGHSAMKDALATVGKTLSRGLLEAEAAQNYQLETAMWIGASLEQGVWYEMSAPLLLPGASWYDVPQRIEFAFTQMVPCTAGAAAKNCVEIVLHATPDQTTINNLLGDLGGSSPGSPHADYAASINTRIVVDPATLLPYTREERIHWYVSLGTSTADKILQSEHLVVTTRYEDPSLHAAAQARRQP